MKLKKNIGTFDKIIRILLAVIIGLAYSFGYISGTIGIILLIVGAVFIITAIFNFCPIYFSIGLSSRKEESKA